MLENNGENITEQASIASEKASVLLQQAMEMGVSYAPKIIGAIIVIWVGFKIIRAMIKMLDSLLNKRKIDPSIRTFLDSLISVILKALVLIAAAGMLGVETTSFIAVFGAVGLAVGMALSGTLGHFASGVMILLFKPYKVGDLVEVAGQFGTVKEIQIFNTVLKTLDAKTIIIPNSQAVGGVITNLSIEDKKRVDIDVGISYSDSIDKAREVLQKIADDEPRVLSNEGVTIGVKELGDNAVIFTFRTWCKTEDYWDVFFDLNEKIKKEFDATNGELNFPFPQRDVHMYNVK